MSLIASPMLDFSKLKAPRQHGGVLLVPEPSAWLSAARHNRETLRAADRPLLDSTLAAWRRRTREAVIGDDDRLVFVLGHQPEFIHPGVWAKHVATMRAAAAADGVALNLVVDNDAPKRTTLAVPSVENGDLRIVPVPYASAPTGAAYEQIARQDTDASHRFEQAVHDAMGDRFDASQMPLFFRAFAGAVDAHDWVDQAVTARRAIEADLGVTVQDRRVSDVWCSPLLLDLLAHAERFAAVYNAALASYRAEHRVRGSQRPIPDLYVGEDRCEVPVWAYQSHEPRRRLFVSRRGDTIRLFADQAEIGAVPVRHLASCDGLSALLRNVPGWQLRPRALTLTIWARMLLADLFIHGIGGAKYDRISDTIMGDYYGVAPPQMACVSATLHLDLPRSAATLPSVEESQHVQRDLAYNPDRHLPGGADIDPLIADRRSAVRRSIELRDGDRRNRSARRETFERIRELSAAIVARRSGTVAEHTATLAAARRAHGQALIAHGREYFFGLYDTPTLKTLLRALPEERSFRV